MNDNNALVDYLNKQKDDDLRRSLIKDKLATTMYERQIVKETDAQGNESFREIDVPKPVPEWLLADWATTNFSRKDTRVKMACYKLGLAISSAQSFMEQKGKHKKSGDYHVDMSPTLVRLRNLMAMLLLSEKSNDSELVDKLLRQHIKQESREFIEQKQPQGGFLAPKQ